MWAFVKNPNFGEKRNRDPWGRGGWKVAWERNWNSDLALWQKIHLVKTSRGMKFDSLIVPQIPAWLQWLAIFIWNQCGWEQSEDCSSQIVSFLLTPLLLGCIALGMLSSSQLLSEEFQWVNIELALLRHWWPAEFLPIIKTNYVYNFVSHSHFFH